MSKTRFSLDMRWLTKNAYSENWTCVRYGGFSQIRSHINASWRVWWSCTSLILLLSFVLHRGVATGEHRGHLPPTFFPSHVIFITSHCMNTSTKFVLQSSSGSKNYHRKADYKAIWNKLSSYALIEQCLVLNLERLMSSKGNKWSVWSLVGQYRNSIVLSCSNKDTEYQYVSLCSESWAAEGWQKLLSRLIILAYDCWFSLLVMEILQQLSHPLLQQCTRFQLWQTVHKSAFHSSFQLVAAPLIVNRYPDVDFDH